MLADEMRVRNAAVVACCALLVAAGCEGSGSDTRLQPRGDSGVEPQLDAVVENIPVVENAGEGRWGGVTPWEIREVLTIGAVFGPAPYEFARVGSVDVDSDGNVYVLDLGHRRVRKYDGTGRFLVEMGGDGGGPGEFRRGPSGLRFFDLGGMSLVGDSVVVVHDPWAWKFVYFDRRGHFLRDVGLQLPPPARLLTRLSHRVEHLGGGWLLMHHSRGFGSGPMRSALDGQHLLIRVALDGSGGDTLVTYYQDDMVYRELDERHGEFFPKPFASRWHWAVGPAGRIAFGHGSSYEITVYSRSWKPLGRLKRAIDPPRVTDADIASFRRRFPFGDGMDSLSPRMRRLAASVLDELDFPALWPVFDKLLYDDVGRLWVRRHPRPDDSVAEWDVFDTELRYLGVVWLPSNLNVLKITADRIYSKVNDGDGVDFVKVRELVAVGRTVASERYPGTVLVSAGSAKNN